MKTQSNTLPIILTVIGMTLLFGFMVMYFSQTRVANGSVAFGNDYIATTTDQTWTTLVPKVLRPVGGTLGSVVITTTGTGSLFLYDATTTNVNLRTNGAATSTLVLAAFQITTGTGTFTFDRTFNDGLTVVWTGTNMASTTITYR